MRNIKSIVSLVLAAVILISAVPFTASAEDITKTYEVSTAKGLLDAASEINNSESGGNYVISLNKNISADETSSAVGMTLNNANATVTLIGNNHVLSLTDSLQIINGKLNLGDGQTELTVTLKNNNDCPGIVYVKGKESSCNMYDKVTLKDHEGNNYLGGGVTVEAGNFNMRGGLIDNCSINGGSVAYGGGIAVISGGELNMYGGTVKDCFVNVSDNESYSIGGGVFVTCGSSFNFKNGTIDSCSADYGGGVAIVPIIDEFYYNYDTSENNRYAYISSSFKMENGIISGNESVYGGGIYISGFITADYSEIHDISTSSAYKNKSDGISIVNGTISGNYGDVGGAICINQIADGGIIDDSETPIIMENLNVLKNEAYYGGGIAVFGAWSQTDIKDCVIKNNKSEDWGGGVFIYNNSGWYAGTIIEDTEIIGNTSGNRGAGVYYGAKSKLSIAGEDIIQDNYYGESLNNLNILSDIYPVYVSGSLKGSQIGLSDPTLWDDGLTDEAEAAVSTDYLTNGYKTYNSENPDTFFTSDHNTWKADFSDVNTNEVRLVRNNEWKVTYYCNEPNKTTQEVFKEFEPTDDGQGNKSVTVSAFYDIPDFAEDDYVFAGWYTSPYETGKPIEYTDGSITYTKETKIYAHWIPVGTVSKADEDDKDFDGDYSGFGCIGVQIRNKGFYDTNYETVFPEGLRFISSFSKELYDKIDALSETNVKVNTDGEGNALENVEVPLEYGYAVGVEDNIDKFITDYNVTDKNKYEIKYKGTNVNGVDTTGSDESSRTADTDYRYINNFNCTVGTGSIKEDHRDFGTYRLFTFVVKYPSGTESYKVKNIDARPYIRYYDSNGLLRTFYDIYSSSSGNWMYGGCMCSYNTASSAVNND